MLNKILNISISAETTLLQSLDIMNKEGVKSLFVYNKGQFVSLLTIGDIQRAIIKNIDLNTTVSLVCGNNKIFATDKDDIETIKATMYKLRAECMPVISEKGELIDVYFWKDLFGQSKNEPFFKFNLPVVIMAGGIGTRLKPLTNIIPKPLIPINNKTIIEGIMDRFVDHGSNTFYISVNYKAEMIRYYFNALNNPNYQVTYFQEDKPLGTAGSLSLLKNQIKQTFFVSNCDILIDQDFSEVLKYHREHENEITIIAALKTYPIAYGTIETGENGQLLQLIEKPELTFKINSGMYIIEPHLLNEIPENNFFHITQLIDNVRKKGGKVGVFPISERSWIDIGNWSLFLKENKINV